MSVQLAPSKRSYDQGRKDRNGKGKLQKSSTFNSQNKLSSGDSIFRVLCPTSKIGSIIGKGGNIIAQIREETGAKVRVEDPVFGSDYRVIFISSSDKDSEVAPEGAKELAVEEIKKDDTNGIPENEEGGNNIIDEDKSDNKANDENEDQEPSPLEALQPEKNKSSAQQALLIVFRKLVEGEAEKTGGGDEESDKSANFVIKLVVFASQVGGIVGKNGSVIKQISSDSGAKIQVLAKDDVPPFATPRDEIVQISGDLDVVRNALEAVSQQLLENPPCDEDFISSNNLGGPSSHSFGNHYPNPEKKFQERGIPGNINQSGDILTFRMLCNNDRIGGVIGRGGTIIKTLQFETGCEIKVVERIPGLDERIIVISGKVHPDERISAPQDAVLRVQNMIFRAIPDTQENTVPAKLLINSNQIGCLLGKGGSVIAEMRKSTGAYIRILGKDQLPNCASEDEEVIQINGVFDVVQDALMHVTTRLRDHFFRNAFPSNAMFSDQVPQFPAFRGRREYSPPGMHPNVRPPFQGGLPPHGNFHPHDDRLPFMHRPGVPPHLSERNPSLAWGPQDYDGVPQRRMGGFGGGIHLPIITNISVEVVVPRSCVDAIYGEDGGCLKQIREFSEAKISITDPKPGATETLIVISGTPEQTHAAQSLIQAFVMIESNAS